ncbi:MAG TPA: hypothetical protein VFH33_07360 [Candidatus Krumholzibacteria bacterium]|nr:hypothetical protein [Candidatus Krumholzibacteria bacterium]
MKIPDLVDKPGPDLAVWLNCFSGCRELQIRVSGDGTAFIGVDTILSPAAYREISIGFFPGITPVRYVMIQDTGSCSGGAVIDAVAGLQSAVAVRPTTWGSIKALYQ